MPQVSTEFLYGAGVQRSPQPDALPQPGEGFRRQELPQVFVAHQDDGGTVRRAAVGRRGDLEFGEQVRAEERGVLDEDEHPRVVLSEVEQELAEQGELLVVALRPMLDAHVVEQQVEEFASLQWKPADPDDCVLAAYRAERVGGGGRFTAADGARQRYDGIGARECLLDATEDVRRLRSHEYVGAGSITAKYASFEPEVLLVHRSPFRSILLQCTNVDGS